MLGELLGSWDIGQEPLVDIGPVHNRNSGNSPGPGKWDNNLMTVLPDGPKLLVDHHESPLSFALLGPSPTEHIVRTYCVNGPSKTADEEITYNVTVLHQGFC